MMVRRNWGRLKSSVAKAAADFPIFVAEWPRNKREVFRIMLSKYQGHISIDVRIWFLVTGNEPDPADAVSLCV
jgi:hypothetical protein